MKGDTCGFLHEFNAERMPVCRSLLKYGVCKEPDCPYKHSLQDIKVCLSVTTPCALVLSYLLPPEPVYALSDTSAYNLSKLSRFPVACKYRLSSLHICWCSMLQL